MEFTGRLVNVTKDWNTDKWRVTFTINESELLKGIDKIKDCEKLSITAEEFSDLRSGAANRLMWVMISQLAAVDNVDKWQKYLECLDAYGKCQCVTIPAASVESFSRGWREVKEVGRYIDEYGIEKVSLLCYFGSHLLTKKEFSHLLEGIRNEMIANDLVPPASQEMREALKEWEKIKAYIPNTQH